MEVLSKAISSFRSTDNLVKSRTNSVAALVSTRTSTDLSLNKVADFEKISRGHLLLQHALQTTVFQTGLQYLEAFMTDKNLYVDRLVELFFQEIHVDWDRFYLSNYKDFRKLGRLSTLIRDEGTNDLDKHYLMKVEYIPLREKLEMLFAEELQKFSRRYQIDFHFKTEKDAYLIWESNDKGVDSTSDLAKRVRKFIFRSLVKEFEEQLTTLEPYAAHFKIAKSNRKTLEQVILGVTDFGFFSYRYDLHRNQRTYLNTFAKSLDAFICQRATAEDPEIRLIDQLWRLYTALLTTIEITEQLAKIYSKIVFKVPIDPQDHNIYFNFLSETMIQLQNRIESGKVSFGTPPEDHTEHLAYLKSYAKSCEQIYGAIEIIIPLLSQTLDKSRSGSSLYSSRRKIAAPEQPREFGKTMKEIYANFSQLASSAKIQKTILDQILQ